MLFSDFKKATGADTPNFGQAAYADAQLEAEQEAIKRAQIDQTVTGGMDLYDKFTGEDTPIMDYFKGKTGGGGSATAGEMSAALRNQGVDAAAGMYPESMAGHSSAAALPDVAATAFPEALTGVEGAVGGDVLAGMTELGGLEGITGLADAGLGAAELGLGVAEGAEVANVAAGMFPEALAGAEGANAVAAGAGAAGGGAMSMLGPAGIALMLAMQLGLFG